MTEKAKKSGNKPVSPEIHFRQNQGATEVCTFETVTYSGLSKRELFAAFAMAGINANSGANNMGAENIAKLSVGYADALLEQLAKDD